MALRLPSVSDHLELTKLVQLLAINLKARAKASGVERKEACRLHVKAMANVVDISSSSFAGTGKRIGTFWLQARDLPASS